MSSSEDVTQLAEQLSAIGEPYVVATVVRTVASVAAKPGAKAIFCTDGRMVGWVGGGCALGAVKKAAQQCLEDGEARLISIMPFDQLKEHGLKPGDKRDGVEFAKNMCPSRGVVDVFVEPVLPKPQVILCGATPVTVAIAELAPRIGLKVAVHAPVSRHSTFPAGITLHDGFAAVRDVGARSFIVVATQGDGDEEATTGALNSSAHYVAFVGSRAKVAALKERLAAKGVAPERLADLRGPAGLAIGAVTPEEIALAILADIVQARRQNSARKTKMEAAE
jgi:xanthine dehydrogenase accessory factor